MRTGNGFYIADLVKVGGLASLFENSILPRDNPSFFKLVQSLEDLGTRTARLLRYRFDAREGGTVFFRAGTEHDIYHLFVDGQIQIKYCVLEADNPPLLFDADRLRF
jgi:hypothetical protein